MLRAKKKEEREGSGDHWRHGAHGDHGERVRVKSRSSCPTPLQGERTGKDGNNIPICMIHKL